MDATDSPHRSARPGTGEHQPGETAGPPHHPPELGCRLCRVQEAARHLALSRSKVYALMDAGELGYVKIGRARRIPLDALLAFVAARRVIR